MIMYLTVLHFTVVVLVDQNKYNNVLYSLAKTMNITNVKQVFYFWQQRRNLMISFFQQRITRSANILEQSSGNVIVFSFVEVRYDGSRWPNS